LATFARKINKGTHAGAESIMAWRVAHPQIKIRTLQKAKSAAPEKASQRRNVAEGCPTRPGETLPLETVEVLTFLDENEMSVTKNTVQLEG
jgi:hypothetical protein